MIHIFLGDSLIVSIDGSQHTLKYKAQAATLGGYSVQEYKQDGLDQKHECNHWKDWSFKFGKLKPPQFDGKKGGKYLMWKMKFKVDPTMKGLFEAFQPAFESKLPSKEKAVLDLSIKDQKKQHDTVKMN